MLRGAGLLWTGRWKGFVQCFFEVAERTISGSKRGQAFLERQLEFLSSWRLQGSVFFIPQAMEGPGGIARSIGVVDAT